MAVTRGSHDVLNLGGPRTATPRSTVGSLMTATAPSPTGAIDDEEVTS